MVPPAALIGFSGWASIEVCRRRRILPASATFVQTSSESGHERRFRDVGDESGLPPTPERLRHRSEPTLRTRIGYSRPGYRVVLTRHHSQKSRALKRRIFLNPRNISPLASPGSETVRPQRPGWPVAILD